MLSDLLSSTALMLSDLLSSPWTRLFGEKERFCPKLSPYASLLGTTEPSHAGIGISSHQVNLPLPWPIVKEVNWEGNVLFNDAHKIFYIWLHGSIIHGKGPLRQWETQSVREETRYCMAPLQLAANILLYLLSADRITHTIAFIILVEHWNRKYFNLSTMRDWSDDPLHREQML